MRKSKKFNMQNLESHMNSKIIQNYFKCWIVKNNTPFSMLHSSIVFDFKKCIQLDHITANNYCQSENLNKLTFDWKFVPCQAKPLNNLITLAGKLETKFSTFSGCSGNFFFFPGNYGECFVLILIDSCIIKTFQINLIGTHHRAEVC